MISPISASIMPTVAEAKPGKIEGAAKQFEALMIGQMLKSVQEEKDDDDSTSATMQDVASQQFSQVLANNGGLGLAKLIVKGLAPSKTPSQ